MHQALPFLFSLCYFTHTNDKTFPFVISPIFNRRLKNQQTKQLRQRITQFSQTAEFWIPFQFGKFCWKPVLGVLPPVYLTATIALLLSGNLFSPIEFHRGSADKKKPIWSEENRLACGAIWALSTSCHKPRQQTLSIPFTIQGHYGINRTLKGVWESRLCKRRE